MHFTTLNTQEKVVENHPTEKDPIARQHFSQLLRAPHLGGQFNCRHFVFVDDSHMTFEAWIRKYGRSKQGTPAWRRSPFNVPGVRARGNYFATFFSYLLPFLVICYQIFKTNPNPNPNLNRNPDPNPNP